MEFHLVTSPQADLQLAGDYAGPVRVRLDVDWAQEFALVADMGEQRTAGFSVLPGSVTGADGQVDVRLTVVTPTPGSMVAQVITHPFCVVRIPRAGLDRRVTVSVWDQSGNLLARLPAEVPEGG